MNMTQLRVVIQYLVVYAAGYLASKGWMDQNSATELLTAAVALIAAGYSAWKSRTQGKINTAASVAGVTIVAPDHLAQASPKANVVSSNEVEVKDK